MGDYDHIEIRDEDTDALSVLPLGILPFKSVKLREIRMVKNSHLESVLSMFQDDKTGSGHLRPMDISREFANIASDDIEIVNNCGKLHSFDVYSLRISLRGMGIQVNDTKYLKLSPDMQKDLDRYVRPFTDRLIQAIYGEDGDDAGTTDVTQLLKDPDVNKVRTKLAMIANKIHIDLADVPVFLEDYGDIYLSIAYYRNILDKVRGPLEEFSAAMDTIQRDRMLKESAEIVSTAKKIQGRANKMRDVLIDRFDMFTKSTNDMWNDMNADRFGEFKMMVEENHSTLGGLLC